MGRATYDQSKERFRPDLLPGLRRVVWTRRPAGYADAETPGVLEFTAEPPAATHARLRADGRQRCALLGGGELYTAWLRAGLVDELCVTVESWLFGAGTPLADAVEARLELLEAKVLAPGGPALLRYAIRR
jgi:dihydrofolate reductase